MTKFQIKNLFFFISVLLFFKINIFPQAIFVRENVNSDYSAQDIKIRLEKIISENKENIEIKEVKPLDFRNYGINIFVIKISRDENLSLMESYLKNKNNFDFSYVQVSGAYEIEDFPNDEFYLSQWGLRKISIADAWEQTTGSDSVLIGIIDTGLDFNHSEFSGRFFINFGEIGTDDNGNDKSSNGIDDDGNGFTDDFRGWNFVSDTEHILGNNNPFDDNGHGTFVAGIIGAKTNNAEGVSGINSVSPLFIAKAFDSEGYGKEEDVVQALIYLANNGANLINMSFGDYTYSQVMHDVIRYVSSLGVVLIASAGNSSSQSEHYPSGFSEVISVAASDENNDLAGFSNYGTSIDLLAPGTNILSTGLDNNYVTASGTSASAPFVSGVISLILSLERNLNYSDIRQILRTTANDIYDDGFDIYSGAGVLNAGKAVATIFNSQITVNSPGEDFWFSDGDIKVSVSVLSPYFDSFGIDIGAGENPDSWEHLFSSEYQVFEDSILSLNASELYDTNYTLKLYVQNSDGGTSNFYRHFGVDKSPPFPLFFVGLNGYYSGGETFYSISVTNEFTKAKFHFSEGGAFFLDNGSINIGDNRFVHSGFVPPEYLSQNENYSFDISYINKAGLKSNLSEYIQDLFFETGNGNDIIKLNKFGTFSLNGEPYENIVTLNNKKYILLNEFEDFFNLKFYEISNDTLLAENPDYILPGRRIPVFAGKIPSFGDDKFYLISFQYPQLSIDFFNENANGFENLLTSGALKNLLFAGEIGDGFYLISSENDNIYFDKLNNNLSLERFSLVNQSEIQINGNFANSIVSQNAAVFNYSDHSEIFLLDFDGDLIRIFYNATEHTPDFTFHDYFPTLQFSTKAMFATVGCDSLLLFSLGDKDFFNENVWFYSEFLCGENINLIENKAFISNNLNENLNNTLLKKPQNSNSKILLLGNEQYILDKNNDLIYYNYENFDRPIRSILINSEKNYFTLPNSNGKLSLFSQTNFNVPRVFRAYSIDTNIVFFQFSDISDTLLFSNLNTGANYTFTNINNNFFYDSNAVSGINKYLFSYDNLHFSDTLEVFAHSRTYLTNVEQVSERAVKVEFSNKMPRNLPLEANEIFNLANEENIISSLSFFDENSYLINFVNNLPVAKTLKFSVRNSLLYDIYGSPVLPDTFIFESWDSLGRVSFFVSHSKIVSEKSVEISFNIPFDSLSVSDKNNYSVFPENGITNIKIIGSKTISLFFEYPIGAVGKNYLLKIKNVKSHYNYGGIKIPDGSGSQVMLVSVKSSLNDEYVFPNPVNENFTQYLTFANLTEKYRITIFDLSGDLINKFEVNNSPGAFIWNLEDKKGRKISSGVYLYLIEKIDDEGEVSESKVNKFAVVK